jgi:hypothetical protein
MEGQTQDDCKYGVLQVTIQEVTDSAVTFAARSAGTAGDRNQSLLRSFTVPLAEVWTAPIAGAPAPVPLRPGASGNLFLSKDGWQTRTPDGFGISGIATFKWPLCGAAPSRVIGELGVIPSSIVVHGHLEGETELFELELLGPDADEAQAIEWTSAAMIELRLSPRGAARLGTRSRSTTVKAWPVRILIQGAPTFDPSVPGEVDLLDVELAAEIQQLAFATRGQGIRLALTQDGLGAFHVTPEVAAANAQDAGGSELSAASQRTAVNARDSRGVASTT